MTSRASERCAVAAAGMGLVLASFGTGSLASAATSAHHATTARPAAGRVHPHIQPTTGTAVTMVPASLAEFTVPTLAGGASGALAPLTVTDPGSIRSTDTVTLSLLGTGQGLSVDTTAAVSVVTTGTGTTAGPVTVTPTSLSFVVTKTTNATDSTYVLSGIHVVGSSAITSGAFGFNLQAVYPGDIVNPFPVGDAYVDPVTLGAVMHLIPAAYGATSPDTAAAVFRAVASSFTRSLVLASDSEPQDAESANYLVAGLSGLQEPNTGILLTDPTTLSPAVSSVLGDYRINTIYIVGGTSVVSAGIETQLTGEGYTVIRLAGATQYDTNAVVTRYVAANVSPGQPNFDINYTKTQYNSTTGASSATSTGVGSVKTAIVASGSIDSFQDGIVSGPLSIYDGLPVILTTPTSLSATAEQLLTEGSYKQVILLGGPAAVSDAVEAQLTASTASGGAGVVAFRIAGSDASDTSTKLAHFIADNANFDLRDHGTDDGGALIARGSGFQDALATGPYGGEVGRVPITLTENASVLGAPLTAYLKYAGSQCVFSLQAVGGPLSVSPAVQQAGIDAEFSGLPGCSLFVP